jgi:hypothetical protein
MGLQSVASGLHGFPGWGTTAASLGREAISDYTQNERVLQTTRANRLERIARRKRPPGGGFHEIGGVFILAEGKSGFDAVNGAARGLEQW